MKKKRKAKKSCQTQKKLLELRNLVRESLDLRTDKLQCEECHAVMVYAYPSGPRVYNDPGTTHSVDYALETLRHEKDCSFTERRMKLGLENRKVRELEDKQRWVAQQQSAIRDLEKRSTQQEICLAEERKKLAAVEKQ